MSNVSAAAGVALLMAGIVCVELAAQPSAKSGAKAADVTGPDAQRAAKLKAMIDAAKAAYAGILEAHNLGRATSNNEVYAWSNHIRSAEVRAAGSRQQIIKVCQEHLQRMRDLHERVAALGREGAPGGEMHKQAATQFYVAEAELLLMEAQKNEQRP
jgi:hypothetical protein